MFINLIAGSGNQISNKTNKFSFIKNITPPFNITILSFNNLEKISKDLSPRALN